MSCQGGVVGLRDSLLPTSEPFCSKYNKPLENCHKAKNPSRLHFKLEIAELGFAKSGSEKNYRCKMKFDSIRWIDSPKCPFKITMIWLCVSTKPCLTSLRDSLNEWPHNCLWGETQKLNIQRWLKKLWITLCLMKNQSYKR